MNFHNRDSVMSQARRHLALLLTTAFSLTPFVWMFSLSLKSPDEMFRTHFTLWPHHLYAAENYSRVFERAPMLRFMENGIIVCGTILLFQILLAAPCAYALARLHFRGGQILFGLVLVAMLIPHQVLAVPLFLFLSSTGLLNTYAALILPGIVSPLAIVLLRQTFKMIPDDLVHSARLDGLSEFSIVWWVMVPLAMPTIAAFSIFSFVSHWNDLFWPLIVIHSDALATPPLGIANFRSQEASNDYGPLMAGTVVIAAPLVVAFLVAQRRFIDGLTLGGVK